MNHNPRKFEEKIALNKQKQAEQDKQFEDIIRDVNTIRDEVPNVGPFNLISNVLFCDNNSAVHVLKPSLELYI